MAKSAIRLALLALSLTFIANAFAGEAPRREPPASSSHYSGEPDGYYWYDDPSDEQPTSTPLPKPQPPSGGAGATPLSTAWLRANIDKYRDAAIDDPTPDNVAVFAYLQRLTLDRAEQFAKSLQLVNQLDPALDETARRPLANAAAAEVDEAARKSQESVIRRLGKDTAIWVFYSSTCPHCVRESGVLATLQRLYGIQIYPISLDGYPLPGGQFPRYVVDNGQAERLGVTGTPTLFLAKPPGDVIMLAEGEIAMSDLMERMLRAARAKQWITDEEWRATRVYRPTYLVDHLPPGIEADLEDPQKLLAALRQAGIDMRRGQSTPIGGATQPAAGQGTDRRNP